MQVFRGAFRGWGSHQCFCCYRLQDRHSRTSRTSRPSRTVILVEDLRSRLESSLRKQHFQSAEWKVRSGTLTQTKLGPVPHMMDERRLPVVERHKVTQVKSFKLPSVEFNESNVYNSEITPVWPERTIRAGWSSPVRLTCEAHLWGSPVELVIEALTFDLVFSFQWWAEIRNKVNKLNKDVRCVWPDDITVMWPISIIIIVWSINWFYCWHI